MTQPQGRSRQVRRWLIAAGAVIGLATGVSSAAALGGGTPVVIDDFSTSQSPRSAMAPAPAAASGFENGAGIIGGQREAIVSLTSGAIGSADVDVSGGALGLLVDGGVTSTLTLTWDGSGDAGSSAIDFTGLGGADLTADGTQNAIRIQVTQSTGIGGLITLWGGSGNLETGFLTPAVAQPSDVVVPYRDFFANGSGVAPSAVGALQLRLLPLIATDTSIGEVTTDALVKATLKAELTGDVDGDGLVEPGDTLTYTAVVSNPDDLYDAGSEDTRIDLTLDADLVLVPSTVRTTAGTVTDGNDDLHTHVIADAVDVPDASSVTIAFEARVSAAATEPLSVQGSVSEPGTTLTSLKTDDESQPGTADPTLTQVVTGAQPSAAADAYQVQSPATLSVPAPGVLGNDSTGLGPVTAVLGTTTGNGQLTLSPDGSFTYAPAAGFVGADTFTYRAATATNRSAAATVTITVAAASQPQPQPPVTPPPAATCLGKTVTITARAGRITLGTAGADVIRGTAGADRIQGRGGNDVICGLGGKDTIDGGAGNDRIDAGSGNDTVTAGAGNDVVNGGAGNDTLTAGRGRDTVAGAGGRDLLALRDGARDAGNCGAGRDRARADATDRLKACEAVARDDT